MPWLDVALVTAWLAIVALVGYSFQLAGELKAMHRAYHALSDVFEQLRKAHVAAITTLASPPTYVRDVDVTDEGMPTRFFKPQPHHIAPRRRGR